MKIQKRILSILLCVALIFISAPLTASAMNYEYTLVPGTATDATTNVAKLMDTIIGHSADDNVTVYVSNSGTASNTPSWYAYRSKDTYHPATVTYTTLTGEGKAKLYSGSGANITVYGDSNFSNLHLYLQNEDMGLCTSGYNVTIDSTVDISYNGYSDYGKVFFGGRSNRGTIAGTEAATVLIDGKSINGANGGVIIGTVNKSNTATYINDQTLISKDNTIRLYFAGIGAETTFEKNLNIILENATVSSVKDKFSDGGLTTVGGAVQILANGTSTIDANAIYSVATGETVNASGGVYLLDSSNQDGTLSLTETVGTYAINSEFTYAFAYDAVNQPKVIYYGTDVLALSKSGNYQIGYVNDLSEIANIVGGEWTDNGNGTLSSGFKAGSYFVAPNGKGDGRSLENAAKGITKVISSIIEDGYGAGDEVTIYVSGGEGATSVPESGLAVNYAWPWPKNGNNEDITTQANITITTMPGATAPATLSSSTDAALVALANTTFKNITLLDMSGNKTIYTNGYNVTFEDDVTFKSGSSMADYSPTIYTGSNWSYGVLNEGSGTLTINGDKNFSLSLGGFGNNASGDDYKLNGDQKIIINGGTVNKLYLLNNNYGDKETVYNSNISIVLNGATLSTALVGNGTYVPTINGAIQFVSTNNSTLPNLSSIETFAKENEIPFSVFDAGTSTDGTLIPSDEVGKFIVESDKVYAYVYDSVNNTDTLYYGTDSISVKEEGSYTIGFIDDLYNIKDVHAGNWVDNEDGTMTRYPDSAKIGKYYISPNGSGDGRTVATPAISVSVVMKSIIDDGYGEGDYATIYVAGGEGATSYPANGLAMNFATSWPRDSQKNDLTTAAKITITSMPNATAPATLSFSPTTSGNKIAFTVMADTVFKNITLVNLNGSNYKYIYTNGFNVTFDEDVLFKSGSTTEAFSELIPVIYVGSNLNYGVRYDGNSTLTINNSTGNKKYAIAYGGTGTAEQEGHTLNGIKTVVVNGGTVTQLNLHGNDKGSSVHNATLNMVLNAATLSKAVVERTAGKGYSLNGAIQIVANNGTVLPDLSAIKTFADTNNIPFYLLNSSENYKGVLMTTETTGKYDVTEGYTAVAVNDSEKQFVSEDNELKVETGSYTVSMLDNSNPYTCDGKTINVYIPCKIDFAKISPDIYSVDNKLFVGWKLKSTGEYATSSTMLNIGDVLEAQYIDCTDEDFGVTNTEIRTVGDDALRFIVNVKNSFFNAIPNAGEYGSIVLPTNSARGRDIYLDEAVIYDWTWDEETKSIFTANTTGGTPAAVKAVNLFDTTDDGFKYTVSLTGITEGNYNRYYMMRGYIKYVDYNGVERVAYTNHANTSMYHTAIDTVDTITAPEIKAKVQAIIDYIEITEKNSILNSSKTLVTGYEGCADSNPNHKIFSQNGIYSREINIASGKNLSSPITIAAYSDPHLQHINNRDLEIASVNTLSTYRGRGWTNSGQTGLYLDKLVQYSKHFDKTVVIGDIMDFMSHGSAEAMQRMLIDKFTPEKLIMVCGNHEIEEILVPDISGLKETLTFDEKVSFLEKYWINDFFYSSEIVKDTEGNDGAIIVTMMDGQTKFYESQKALLEADINTAREKGIPVLLFVHVPIDTKNPNEPIAYRKYGKDAWGTSEDYDNAIVIGETWTGREGSDQATMDVYNLIVQNYDVIKGVFHAHHHANLYTEIMAQDAEGNFVKDANGDYIVIPQHGVASIADTGGIAMLNITIE